jgi:uncharacterized protein (TIGR02466 family)
MIIPIFSTPIYKSKLNKEFTDIELNFMKQTATKCHKNIHNAHSINSYILDCKEFKDLKENLTLEINKYFKTIYNPLNDCEIYITQSWLNYINFEQQHHSHCHPNSFISGVLYFAANKDFDCIILEKNIFQQIKMNVKSYNNFNSDTYTIPVETKDLLLFPSNTMHHVPITKNPKTRVSLSFNTFIKGTIGDKDKLFELKL